MMDFLAPIIQISTDPLSFFQFFGYWGLASILFAETGLFGFFLPGDSLLLTLGLIASKGHINLKILIPSLIIATVLGDHFSYFLGRQFNEWVRRNVHRIFLEEHHLLKAQDFYDQHGGKTILFCKFIPVIRTFAPFVAATTKMNFLRFAIFDIVGAVLWICLIVGSSYYFGKTIDFDIQAYFHYIVIGLFFILISPFLFKVFKKKS
jgi:membrane-associated protein